MPNKTCFGRRCSQRAPSLRLLGLREGGSWPQEVRAKDTKRLRRAGSCFLPKPWFSAPDVVPPWGVPGVPCQQPRLPVRCHCSQLGAAFPWRKQNPKAQMGAGTPRRAPSPGSARPLVAGGEQRRPWSPAAGQAPGKPSSSESRVQIRRVNLYILFGPQAHRLIIILSSRHSHTLIIGARMASFLLIFNTVSMKLEIRQ